MTNTTISTTKIADILADESTPSATIRELLQSTDEATQIATIEAIESMPTSRVEGLIRDYCQDMTTIVLMSAMQVVNDNYGIDGLIQWIAYKSHDAEILRYLTEDYDNIVNLTTQDLELMDIILANSACPSDVAEFIQDTIKEFKAYETIEA
ncbi:MAG: hypothetical protein QXL94_00710 [Candidatus Parvarchaeum sp.]